MPRRRKEWSLNPPVDSLDKRLTQVTKPVSVVAVEGQIRELCVQVHVQSLDDTGAGSLMTCADRLAHDHLALQEEQAAAEQRCTTSHMAACATLGARLEQGIDTNGSATGSEYDAIWQQFRKNLSAYKMTVEPVRIPSVPRLDPAVDTEVNSVSTTFLRDCAEPWLRREGEVASLRWRVAHLEMIDPIGRAHRTTEGRRQERGRSHAGGAGGGSVHRARPGEPLLRTGRSDRCAVSHPRRRAARCRTAGGARLVPGAGLPGAAPPGGCADPSRRSPARTHTKLVPSRACCTAASRARGAPIAR